MKDIENVEFTIILNSLHPQFSTTPIFLAPHPNSSAFFIFNTLHVLHFGVYRLLLTTHHPTVLNY